MFACVLSRTLLGLAVSRKAGSNLSNKAALVPNASRAAQNVGNPLKASILAEESVHQCNPRGRVDALITAGLTSFALQGDT